MAINSKIEWTHHTVNLWHGCTKVHAGCDNCYAEKLAKRWGNDIWGNDKPRKLIKNAFGDLSKIQALASSSNLNYRVFVGSMMDIFEKPMPLINTIGEPVYLDSGETKTTEHLRNVLFAKIDKGEYPNITFLFLTKRPSNINKYIPEHWKQNPPKNIMFGTSPVNQSTFDLLTRQLKEVNGRRFLSIEPQLAEIDLGSLTGIDWIIQGGESGMRKRPFDLNWAHKMREDSVKLGVPYFFKQIDKVRDKKEMTEELMVRQLPIF